MQLTSAGLGSSFTTGLANMVQYIKSPYLGLHGCGSLILALRKSYFPNELTSTRIVLPFTTSRTQKIMASSYPSYGMVVS